MKVCPTCQASFVEGAERFVYCPHDETLLQRYDLRDALRSRQKRELNLILPALSFPQRLQRELGVAAQELRRHPLLFIKELLRGEGNSRQRLYRLQSGAALAVIAYSSIVVALVLWGVAFGLPGPPVVLAKPPQNFDEVTLIMPSAPRARSEPARGNRGHLGGSLPQPQRAQGGGSGGKRAPLPASGGARPPAAMQAQIVLPSPEPPIIQNAQLIVMSHVVADPRSVLATVGRVGLSDVPPAPPSAGPGKGGGIGDEEGTGVGKHGKGAGDRDGYGWNTGGKTPSPGGKETTGWGREEGIPMATGSLRPTILYREKARYTEEARANKLQGAVILIATFTADGRITNIRVLKGLPDGLTQEAIKAAQHIRFNPALRNGVPVTIQARLEYNFSLY